ncbi:hypothetical protein CerSpe_117830 [Prunus speciosa]
MEGYNLGVRKGAWTGEEDDLLRQCIENHGEGKWHQVPYKADQMISLVSRGVLRNLSHIGNFLHYARVQDYADAGRAVD